MTTFRIRDSSNHEYLGHDHASHEPWLVRSARKMTQVLFLYLVLNVNRAVAADIYDSYINSSFCQYLLTQINI